MRDKKIELPLAGGCQCGAVRYEISAPPLTLYRCHCSECQAQSSSAFGMSMLVERAAFSVDWSLLSAWKRATDSGSTMTCHFCPTCGTRLFHVGDGDSEIVSLKAGSLDDRSWLKPVGDIWTDSAQPWFVPPEGTLVLAGDFTDMTPLTERWRSQYGSCFH
jgi:hypothetical protein